MTAPIATRLAAVDAASLAAAAALLRAGQPVAVPTETVYGLAADAANGEAVARVYAAKGRPAFNPLIVHVASIEAARAIAAVGPIAEALAARFWPGPLTMVLPLVPGAPIAGIVTAGLDTVAVRVPAHPAMRALLAAFGGPLAAPSANASGRISPTRAAHVLATLDGRIPLVLDGGATGHGIESTIVAVEAGGVRLLRPGPIVDLGQPIRGGAGAGIEAPGQLASHYAPIVPLRLNARAAAPGEWLIGFGAVAGDDTLSAGGDLTEAAARLFDALHRAEASGRPAIAVAPIPRAGLGAAINDRLSRAAAPR